MERNERASLVLACILGLSLPLHASIIYVDANATGLNNGKSWPNAYRYLQDALADANTAAKPVEVRVAQGVYKPDQGRSVKSGDRMAVFPLKSGVSILGGFAGLHVTDPSARDPNVYLTILSADLKGNDIWKDGMTATVLSDVMSSHLDNSQCVVDASSSSPTAVLDGVQIKGVWYQVGEDRAPPGYINRELQGGLFVDAGYPTIRNCVFTENLACSVKNVYHGNPTFTGCRFVRNYHLYYAPALFTNVSSVTVSQCTFQDNATNNDGGAMVCANGKATIDTSLFLHNAAWSGGAILNWLSEISLTSCDFRNNTAKGGGAICGSYVGSGVISLENCTFYHNTATWGGGAVAADLSMVRGCSFCFNTAAGDWGGAINGTCGLIADSLFVGNQALAGGAIYNSHAGTTLENCIFAGNTSRDDGGAIMLWAPATLAIRRCSLQGNRSARGNALYAQYADVVIKESIAWDANAFFMNYSKLTVTHSDLYDPCSSPGNISVDPLFARLGYWDPNGTPNDPNDDFWVEGDYHLESQAGRWDPNTQSWVIDNVTSPCIDAGDPNDPVGDEPVPNGGRINMGAYGGTAEASKSPSSGSAVIWRNSAFMRWD